MQTFIDEADSTDPYKRDPFEMNPKEYSFTDLVAAIANATEIAYIMKDDVLFDQVTRELQMVCTQLDSARLWAQEGNIKFVKPPVA